MKNIVKKPWGMFEILDEGKKYTLKKIVVNPGGKLSLQSHQYRSEHWLVAQGQATIILDEKTYNLNENEHISIPKGSRHRLENSGSQNLIIIEMWFGEILDENDIKRYEDLYNRD